MLKRINLPLDVKELDNKILNNLDAVFKAYQEDGEKRKEVLKMHKVVSKMMNLTSTNFGVFAVVQSVQQISYQMIEIFVDKGLIKIE